MYDWVPIAVAIVAAAAVSGVLRRHFAPLRGERRPSKKGGLIESIGIFVIFAIFLLVVLAIVGPMTEA
jgi:O-antigen/teichoic acid export membrane protein